MQHSGRLHHCRVSAVYVGVTFNLRLSSGRLPHNPTQL